MITHHHQSIHFITPIESNDGILMIEWNQQQQKTMIVVEFPEFFKEKFNQRELLIGSFWLYNNVIVKLNLDFLTDKTYQKSPFQKRERKSPFYKRNRKSPFDKAKPKWPFDKTTTSSSTFTSSLSRFRARKIASLFQ